MLACRVTLIANCGVMIECSGAKIFSDAFHRKKTVNFSTVNEQRQLHMIKSPEFRNADAMIFTHKHADHYSHYLISQTKKLTPGIKLISPVDEFEGQTVLVSDRQHIDFGKFSADFVKLQHDGEQYADVPNYGYLLDIGGFTVFNCGDAMLCEKHLPDFLEGRKVDLALMNFPWLTLRKGRKFIEQFIKPRHLMFFHIPFEEDNISGFREACFKSLPLMENIEDVRLLTEPFQVEEIF